MTRQNYISLIKQLTTEESKGEYSKTVGRRLVVICERLTRHIFSSSFSNPDKGSMFEFSECTCAVLCKCVCHSLLRESLEEIQSLIRMSFLKHLMWKTKKSAVEMLQSVTHLLRVPVIKTVLCVHLLFIYSDKKQYILMILCK